MKKNKKQIILYCCLALVAISALWIGWSRFLSPTRIAFVNYQAIQLGQIAHANNNSFIRIDELAPENLDKASHYDMVFVNGMGLRIEEEQREALRAAADKGTPVLTTAATNPDNLIVSVDSVDSEFLRQYLNAGGRTNLRSMLNYVRRFVDGKRFLVKEMKDPQPSADGLLFHADPKKPDGEELYFGSVAEYERFLRANGLWKEGAQRVIVTGQMGVPDSLVSHLERSGKMVYPVSSIIPFIAAGHADSVAPQAVVNMAHGRLGDAVVEYLAANNVLLFSPLNVNRDYDEWRDDKMGMSGGFMSQSIVTPEIDGAIRPYSLFAHYKGKDGLPEVRAIPGRLEEYVETIDRYLSLRVKPNSQKRVAIFYFKGPGQNSLVAEGMEVAPSLFNLLTRMKAEGYDVGRLPATAAELEKEIDKRGRVFGSYAKGAQADFVKNCNPQLIRRDDYERWAASSLEKGAMEEIVAVDGEFPGHGLHTDSGELALAALRFGNVVLIPQTAAGLSDDDFAMVHGTEMAPPHAYVGAYLWARHGFKADALVHFGAHGSLEFTPRKQVALDSGDWSDRLVGTMPHFYVYSTSNVGEAMMAKRRSYAGIINYLTPPFMESNVRGIYMNLNQALIEYNKLIGAERPDNAAIARAARRVKERAVELGIHRELRLDSVLSRQYSEEEIARIENFAEELANEKINGALYVMGVPYDEEHLRSTVTAMTVDPIAYSLYALDREQGRAGTDVEKHKTLFTQRYVNPARALVARKLASHAPVTDAEFCAITGISAEKLAKARGIDSALNGSKDLFTRMMVMGSSMTPDAPTAKLSERTQPKKKHGMGMIPGMNPEKAIAMARKMGADDEAIRKMEAAMKQGKGKKGTASSKSAAPHGGMSMGRSAEIPEADRRMAETVMEAWRAVTRIGTYYDALLASPQAEFDALLSGLSGGYIHPTAGGDPVLNPNVLPTGRNLFAVNAEETPSLAAWEKGKDLAEKTINMYRKAHGDSLPRKVSYTLWSSEFIETEGATIAQVLYMLGVEPVRDPFGRVTDLRLIPVEELGRPRIDVVVQTSGQLRDLAASRLFLINRAVQMAAAASDKDCPNYVAEGIVESERHLTERGVSPKEARKMASARVFGGVNGNYGSGIQEMVEAGDRWENESEIAETYINNMNAQYGSEEDWERVTQFAFEAALTNTDAVVQPRQSNTWGALSLDHVYEFMGGMNIAVRNVTGKDPDAYLSDYRNRNNARMQEVKEAIGVESRTTILNPTYIKEKMKGGSGDASAVADVVRNTYGWNVMKPDAIDNELWDGIYDTYVRDVNNLGVKQYFKDVNPAAIEEITAVMMETARKGMWKATPEQLAAIAELHTEVVNEKGASCSGFVCDNAKLRDFIAEKAPQASASSYRENVAEKRGETVSSDADGKVLKKEELNAHEKQTATLNGLMIAGVVVLALVTLFIFMRRRGRNDDENGEAVA